MLLGVFAYVMTAVRRPRASLLWLAPALFLFLSSDEALELHEWVGGRLARSLVRTNNGEGTAFYKTGFWWVVLGPAFVVVMGLLAAATRPFWRGRWRVMALMAAGAGTFLAGAVGGEVLTNALSTGRAENFAVTVEEFGELVGVTLFVWGALELLRSHGIGLSTSANDPASGVARAGQLTP
jgi:hypothetical protein